MRILFSVIFIFCGSILFGAMSEHDKNILQNLTAKNPFGDFKKEMAAAEVTKPTNIDLRSVVKVNGRWHFSLSDTREGKSYWLQLGERNPKVPYVVEFYDDETNSVIISCEVGTYTMSLKERDAPPPPAQAAPGSAFAGVAGGGAGGKGSGTSNIVTRKNMSTSINTAGMSSGTLKNITEAVTKAGGSVYTTEDGRAHINIDSTKMSDAERNQIRAQFSNMNTKISESSYTYREQKAVQQNDNQSTKKGN